MRNPERIRPFLDKVAEAWEKYPDLRFGQLVMDIVPDTDRLWNCEEEEFLNRLDNFVTNIEKKHGGNMIWVPRKDAEDDYSQQN